MNVKEQITILTNVFVIKKDRTTEVIESNTNKGTDFFMINKVQDSQNIILGKDQKIIINAKEKMIKEDINRDIEDMEIQKEIVGCMAMADVNSLAATDLTNKLKNKRKKREEGENKEEMKEKNRNKKSKNIKKGNKKKKGKQLLLSKNIKKIGICNVQGLGQKVKSVDIEIATELNNGIYWGYVKLKLKIIKKNLS